MATALMAIKETVGNVVDRIARILRVEVCVVDDEIEIVASTREFRQRKGGQVRSSFLLPLFSRTEATLILSPGRDPLCQGCPHEQNCPHTIELDVPVVAHNRTVGVLSAIGFSEEARRRVMDQSETVREFLGLMAMLLGSILESRETERLNACLQTVLEHVDAGLAVTDNRGMITHGNELFLAFTGMERADLGRRGIDMFSSLPALTPVSEPDARMGSLLFLGARPGASPPAPSETSDVMDGIVGHSPAFLAVKTKIARVAASPATVLLLGESGTGKEVFARAIHALSPRRPGPFVAVNCAAIPETLLESELFGYEGGAFTGARKGGKPGKLEQANGGTFFLDEIGDMPLSIQGKLLRVLEDRRVERVGSVHSVTVDIRIVSATNQLLEQLVREKRFRADLYYRLAVVPIPLPPLRERPGDVVLLCHHLLAQAAAHHQRSGIRWSQEALHALRRYDWPGNVRELLNTVEYALHMGSGHVLTLGDLPAHFAPLGPRRAKETGNGLHTQKEALERDALESTLHSAAVASRTAAARLLGISRSSLYRKLRKHGLE